MKYPSEMPDNGTMNKMIRCALIGLGRIASSLEDDALREKPATHAGAIAANPHTELVGGFDIDLEARRQFASRWKLKEEDLFDNAEDLLRQKKPDFLHIATHEDSHLEYLELAAREEVPLVILEKPVSNRLHRAVNAGKKLGNTRVIVNHERRYSLDYRKVREHITRKTYGDLLSVSGRLYMGMKRPVNAILLHDGTHMMDIIPFLTGSPLKNLKILRPGKDNSTIYATADSNGVTVLCEFGNSRDHLVFELELSFSKGRIRVGNGIYEEMESRESTFYEKMRSLYPSSYEKINITGYFSGMLEDAVRVFKNPGVTPVSSYEDGVASLRTIQAIRKKIR